MDYLNKLKNFLSGKKAPIQQVQPTQSFGNNLMVKLGQSPVGRGLVNTQRFMESPRPIQLPQVPQMMNPTVRVGIPNTRFQVPVQPVSFARDIVNEPIKWTANTLSDASVNLGRTIRGDNISNYQNLKSPVTKLGYQVGGAMLPQNVQGLNVDNRTQEWLGNIGGSVAGPLSVYGGGKAKNLIFNNTVKEGLKKSIFKGAIEGAKIGGGYGIASGLDVNRNEKLPQQLLNTAVSGGLGVGLGGILGGAVGGAGSLNKLTKVAPEVQAQLRDAKGRWVAGQKPVKPPKMPQAQWDFQLNFNHKYKRNPYEPVYPSDLNKAVAYETEKRGVGLSIRDVSKDRNPLGKPNVSNAGLYDTKILNRDGLNYDLPNKNGFSLSNETGAGSIKAKDGSTLSLNKSLIKDHYNNREFTEITAKSPSGKDVAYAKVRANGDTLTIHQIGIKGGEKGKGYNTSLLNGVIEEAKKAGYKTVVADDIKPLNSQGYWQKHGFKIPEDNNGIAVLDISKPRVAQQPKGVTNKVGQNQISPAAQVQPEVPQAQVNQLADNASNEANALSYGRQAPKPEQAPLPEQPVQSDQLLNTQNQKAPSQLVGEVRDYPTQANIQSSQSQKQGLLNKPLEAPSSEQIISEAKKEISTGARKIDKRSLRELGDDIYSQWVDRFHPITKAVGQVEKSVKEQGAELRPEVNPRYTIKRYLGAGGIAENKFNNEFKPILKEIDDLGIDKSDLDVYLKNRRDVGFGEVGREIKGSDPVKAQGVVSAIEAKYGEGIKGVADKLYNYQNKMFDELVEAGFIDEKNSKLIRTQNPDYVPFFRDMESQIENYLGMPSNKLQQAKNPLAKIEGSDKKVLSPVESIIANTFKYRAAIEKNNVAKSIVGLQKAMPELGFKKVSQSGTDTITVWDNGQKSFYQVGDDIAETVKGLNEEQMNSVFKLLTIPSSILRQGATGRNPAFMLPNMVRDQLDAALNSKYGYVPFVDYAKGLSHLLRKDEVYQNWQKSGAQISLSDLSGRKGISELFQEKQGKKKFYNWIGRGLDVAGQLSEQPTRIGLFNKAYQKTKNPLIGAMEAREGTLDFARMGSKMKVANSLIPFLNVGIQGFDKMARTAKANPAKFALKMGVYGATPTIITTLWNINNFPEEYKEIPQYEKNGNFVIVTGRTDKGTVQYFTIPKGNVIQYIANPIENFMSYMTETNPQSVKEMTLQFLSSGAPVIGDGSSFSEIGLKTIGNNLPQAIKPSAENLMNKSFFKFDPKKGESKAIVPAYLQNKADGDQSYEFTPSAYKTIGKALNISPLKVQNFLEGHLAGYVKEPISIYETMKGIADGDGVDRDKAFMIRRFLKETYPTIESKSSTGSGVKRELAKAEETSMLAGAEASGFKNPFKKKEQPKPTGSEKITEVSWESEAGRKTTVKLNTEAKKQTGIDAFNKENPNLENARKIYKAPSDQVSSKDKEAIYKQLGFTREQLDYDHKASGTFNTDERVAYIQSKSPNHDKLIANLTTGREMSIAGNRFATDAVIDKLYKDKLISISERKQLKALMPEKKNQGPVTGTKAKKLKVKFPTIKPPKIGSGKSKKSVFKAPKVTKPKVEKIVFKKKKKK